MVNSFWGGGSGSNNSSSAAAKAAAAAKKPANDAAAATGTSDLPPAALESATPLPVLVTLNDTKRQLTSVSLSPDEHWALCTDGSARVMLLDTTSMTFVRLWKGYRDAKCMWLAARPVAQTASAHAALAPPPALFMVLYATKRGLLEIWLAPFGGKVAAFNIGEGSVVVAVPPGSGSASPQAAHSDTCYVIRPNGHVLQLTVPFVCALSAARRGTQREKHVLSSLSKMLLSRTDESSAWADAEMVQFQQHLDDLESPKALLQALHTVTSVRHLPEPVVLTALDVLCRKAQNIKDGESEATAAANSADASATTPPPPLPGVVPESVLARLWLAVRQQQAAAYDRLIALQPTDAGDIAASLEDSARLDRVHLVGADPSLPTVLRLLYNVLCLDAAAGVNADAAQSADISLATLLAFGGDELINATHSLTASREVARVPLRADLSDADRLALARLVFQPLQVELAEPTTVLQAVTQLRLTPADLATLFITWWGALPYTSLLRIGLLHAAAVFVIHFAAHLRQEQRLLSGNADAKTAAASPLWHACLTFCTNSSRLVHACLLARMLAAVPEDPNEPLPAQDDCTSVAELADRLETALALAASKLCLGARELDQKCIQVYVHEGQPLDTAGLLLSDAGLDISHIDQTLSNVTSDSVITRLRAQVLQGSGSDASDAPSQPVVRALSCLALRFPPLREREQTLAVLIWARLCRFQTNAALHDSFALAQTDMAQIGDVGLRRRLAHAAWHCLLRKRLGEVAALNAKVGKTLKLQLCERNFGVDDVTLMRILTLQSQFLRQWLADVQMAVEESSLAGTLPSSPMSETATNGMGVALGTSESPCPAAENILVHGTWAANAAVRAALVARPVTGGASALGPALNGAFQRQPSVGLLQAHIVLCDALRMIMLQKLRGVRALFLFGEALRARLFSPLHVPPDGAAAAELNGSLLAPEVTEAREGMAARVLSAAMHTQQPSWEEALSFVEMLGVSADFVATRKLVALVEMGQDTEAMEVWATLSDANRAARDLLLVCRRRLKRVLATSKVRGQAGVELVAQLPQRVAAWILDTPESDGSGAEGEIGLQPVKATCSLMRLAAELLRTAEGGGDANPDSDAVMAMTCVEAIQ